MRGLLAELGCGDVRYIVNTHSNADHVSGNHFFPGAVIIAHEKCREYLWRHEQVPAACLPNLTFHDSITLHFNSEEIRVIAFPGGHTADDAIVHFVHANLVFLGDIIVADTFPVIWLDRYEGTGVDRLTGNLRQLMDMLPAGVQILSSHGRDYTQADLQEYYATIVQTIAIVRGAVEQGKSLEEIQRADLLKAYRAYDSRQFPLINADFWVETIYQDATRRGPAQAQG